MDLSKLTKTNLLSKCEELGITSYKSKNKSQLIELINNATNKNSENNIITQKTYSFIEVCAGGGGLSSGLIKAGFTPVLLNDNNSDCCETLKRNHPDTNIICGSMDEIDYSKYIGVDLLTGGVPCQSFSQAGLRKGLEDPRGDLMLKFIDILNLIKPKLFMIENVKGLLTHDKGETLNKIINSFNTDLYNITYKCLDASKYDVPQKRERVFIVGVLKSLNRSFEFPVESTNKKLLKDVLFDVPLSNGLKYNEEKQRLFKMIPQGGCWINLPEEIQKEYLGNSYNSGGGKRGILYRLSMEKPSLTLLCTPSQKQTERCHPLEERPLTIREYARIQTFDDDYDFIGSINSQYKQIGNAVPVELAKHMGKALLSVIEKREVTVLEPFNMTTYFKKIDEIIKNIFSRDKKDVLSFDILDTEKMKEIKLLSLKLTQYQMNIGEIWQTVIGNYENFEDLKTGDPSGLDILSSTRKIIIELKNRTNTDNDSSRKTNFDKLSKYKKEHPEYRCIYANINHDKKEKTIEGYNKKIIHDGVEIEQHVGKEFLKFIFEEKTDEILEFIKKTIDKYTPW
jgi:DNA (cytosine-5)-methyltransferase 1